LEASDETTSGPDKPGTFSLRWAIVIVLFIVAVPFLLPVRQNLKMTGVLFQWLIALCLLPWVFWLVSATRLYLNMQSAICPQDRRYGVLITLWSLMLPSIAIEFLYGVYASPIGEPLYFLSRWTTVIGHTEALNIGVYLAPLYMGGWACLWYATNISHKIGLRFAGLVIGAAMAFGLFLPMLWHVFQFPACPWLYEMPFWFIPQAIGYCLAFGALLILDSRIPVRTAGAAASEASYLSELSNLPRAHEVETIRATSNESKIG
jgi:hypothetical protein